MAHPQHPAAMELSARAHRLDDQIRAVVEEASAMHKDSKGIPGSPDWSDRFLRLAQTADGLLGEAPKVADELERFAYDWPDDPPQATARVVTGDGEVAEPSAADLALLLYAVEGPNESTGHEIHRAADALLFLLRQHPPSVEKLQALAKVAQEQEGSIDVECIRWAAKRGDAE